MATTRRFKKNDFVVYDYEGDKFNAKILEVLPDGYKINVCIDNVNDGDRLMQELFAPENKVFPIQINVT